MFAERTFADSILVAATPEQVYDLVSDVTRTGEWSPICRACTWDAPDDGPRVGATFTGHNETPTRVWETTSTVAVAERGAEFAWYVGPKVAEWRYTMRAEDGGTRLTESWRFSEHAWTVFQERFGDDAAAQLDDRTRAAHDGIPVTLAAIKAIAEAG